MSNTNNGKQLRYAGMSYFRHLAVHRGQFPHKFAPAVEFWVHGLESLPGNPAEAVTSWRPFLENSPP